MKIVISAPTGFNSRELLLPLAEHLENDRAIETVHVITPAAAYHQELFPALGAKFAWHRNPADLAGHATLLASLKPNVIVTPTVGLDTKDTPLIRAGKQLGIPTVTFIASWDNVFKMERLRDRGFSGAEKGRAKDWEFPDYIAVWNKMNQAHVAEKFSDEIDPARIVITGPPRFDYFTHASRIPTKEQLFSYLGWPQAPESARLLHFATTELYPFEYIIRATRAAIDRTALPKDLLLYASVHPGGDMSRHQHYTKYGVHVKYSFGRRERSVVPEFAYLPTTEEIYLLIALWRHAGVLVNQSSTVAIESMAADTPVINVTYGRPLDWWRWRRSMVYRDFAQHYRYITEHGGTRLVSNPRQLVEQLRQYLADPTADHTARQATLAHMITYTDGSSSERLLKYVKKCAA